MTVDFAIMNLSNYSHRSKEIYVECIHIDFLFLKYFIHQFKNWCINQIGEKNAVIAETYKIAWNLLLEFIIDETYCQH